MRLFNKAVWIKEERQRERIMKLGTAFYPEHHSPQQWAENYAKIREAGITRIRIGEFAWSRMETAPGVFDLDWLDDAINLAAEYGIDTILCTPTACPPIWLVEAHPEILPVNTDGRRASFGGRQHRCFNVPAFIEASRRITAELAKRYGTHPNVVAWQIDNELCAEQKFCYCDFCRDAFQEFLEDKYADIEELNQRWGMTFWSQEYQRFDQIVLPRRNVLDMFVKHHPSLMLEFVRFSSDSIVRYARMQERILHQHSPGRVVTTNTDTFVYGDSLDLTEMFRDMDVAANDVYSRDPYEIRFYCDLTRSLKGDTFWLLEYGAFSPKLYEELRLIRRSGAEWVAIFKFKPTPWGQEQGQRCLLTITGEKAPNYHAVRRWMEEENSGQHVDLAYERPRLGLYYDFESSWTFLVAAYDEPLTQKQRYPNYLLHTIYKALYDVAGGAQFAFSAKDIQQMDTLIVPWHVLYDAALEERLMDFVREGGKLIVTYDLFYKNADNVFLTEVPAIYPELLGWQENDFPHYRLLEDKTPIIRHQSVGKGQTWLVRSDLSENDWRSLISEACSG